MSHATALGAAETAKTTNHHCSEYLDPLDNPLVSFKFYYRSKVVDFSSARFLR